MKACTPLLFCTALLCLASSVAWAESEQEVADRLKREDKKAVFSVSLENDLFNGEDNHYTNGIRFSYFSPEEKAPHWLDELASLWPLYKTGYTRWGMSVGQSMYTPADITAHPPDPTDQPYAGWTYISAGMVTDTGKTLDNFQLTAGMVGPASGAEQAQKFIHRVIDSPKPMGWDYQLENEPGLVVTYERKWRNLYETSRFGWGTDLVPSVATNLGNVYTDASVGLVGRFGYDLPADYGAPLIRPNLSGTDFFTPHHDFGWYAFAGLEGKAVARNIFLDGNTFEDSPSVDKKNFVGGLQFGVAMYVYDTRIAYTQVLRTRQFEGESPVENFGAFTLSQRF